MLETNTYAYRLTFLQTKASLISKYTLHSYVPLTLSAFFCYDTTVVTQWLHIDFRL